MIKGASPPPIQIGKHAESQALHYLQQHGLRLIARNFRWRGSEVDLIMQEANTLIFVEVRYRQHLSYGGALATVDPQKQKKLILAGHAYFQKHNLLDNVDCRFDVIGLEGRLDRPKIHWIRDAFWNEDFF